MPLNSLKILDRYRQSRGPNFNVRPSSDVLLKNQSLSMLNNNSLSKIPTPYSSTGISPPSRPEIGSELTTQKLQEEYKTKPRQKLNSQIPSLKTEGFVNTDFSKKRERTLQHIDAAKQAVNLPESRVSKQALSQSSNFLGLPAVGEATGASPVEEAKKYLGIPYKWGGTNPKEGLDCSGLIQLAYKQVGINLPRTSAQQAKIGVEVPNLSVAQPGDLVAFPSRGLPVGHIGIYVGNGKMLHAPKTGDVVKISPVWKNIATIRRVT